MCRQEHRQTDKQAWRQTLTLYTSSIACAVIGTDGVDNGWQSRNVVCVRYPEGDVKLHSDQTLLFDVFYGHQYPAVISSQLLTTKQNYSQLMETR